LALVELELKALVVSVVCEGELEEADDTDEDTLCWEVDSDTEFEDVETEVVVSPPTG